MLLHPQNSNYTVTLRSIAQSCKIRCIGLKHALNGLEINGLELEFCMNDPKGTRARKPITKHKGRIQTNKVKWKYT